MTVSRRTIALVPAPAGAFRGAVSLLAMAVAVPALAQGTPEAVQTKPGDVVTARPTPGADSTATPAAGTVALDESEEIVVTGLRQSLRSSTGIKRNSLAIVDAIVAEDIGKLPDRTVSEALSRVPGVTVERQVGEAGDVFVRGLRDPATTYNGRDIFTAEARSVAPQDFPAGGVAGLEVYKSTTAEQVEGNLAGLINVRSRRPFDFQDFELAGALNATYADRADKFDYNGNLLISNRWELGGGEIGVLVNVSNTQLHYQDSARFVSGDFFALNADPARPGTFVDNGGPQNNNATTVRTPVGVGLFQSPGFRIRPSANASVQWRPTPELEFYADGLFQGFRREVSDRLLFVPLFGGGASYTNVQLRPDNNRFVAGLTATGQATPDGFQAATREKTDTYQYAIGGAYDNDRIRVAFDVARTQSKFIGSIYSVDYRLTGASPVNVVFDADRGDRGVEFNLVGRDLTNINNYLYRGFFDREQVARGDDYQYRVDATFKEVAPFIQSIQVGARFVDRNGAYSNGERYSTRGDNVPYGSLPLEFELTKDGYRGDVNPAVRQLNLPTYRSIRGAVAELRNIAGFAPGLPPIDPRVSYEADETSFTGYGQINYGFDAGTLRIDGAIGLRAVLTDFRLNGTSLEVVGGGQPDRLVPLAISNSYTDYLPNASLRLRFTDQLQLRAAYTETRSRPFFGQLNPGLRIDPPGGSPIRTAEGGNPNLRPVTSRNYDVSLESYFGQTGLAAVSLFRRDVTDFIVNAQFQTQIPDFGTVNIRGPVNTDNGRIQGVEVQFRTFFDFDFVPEFARGFGTELNYTYIDNELSSGQAAIQFPDVSKHSYNIVGFFEADRLSARVAYNYRSTYPQFFVLGTNGSFAGEFASGVSRLDASVSFQLSDRLTLAADASNILGRPFRNFREIEEGVVYPRDVRYEERVYSVGVRFRL